MPPLSRKYPLLKRIDFLKKVPLLASLKDNELALLAKEFHLKEYKKDEVIFQQGDLSRELYIVVKGRVRIFRVSPSGGETSITLFSRTGIIGELAAIDSQPRSATAKAIGYCVLLLMTQEKFLQCMRGLPDLALGMTKLLADKLRWTAAYAETVAQYDAPGRLLHMLLLYNEQFGVEEEPGKRYVLDLDLNQADLASLVSARREWVNRLLRDWHKRGLIEYRGKKIIILDLTKVKAERDSRMQIDRVRRSAAEEDAFVTPQKA